MIDERIKSVYLWQNGMLMVFDMAGQQMADYQGHVNEKGEALERVFPRRLWHTGVWRESVTCPPRCNAHPQDD